MHKDIRRIYIEHILINKKIIMLLCDHYCIGVKIIVEQTKSPFKLKMAAKHVSFHI